MGRKPLKNIQIPQASLQSGSQPFRPSSPIRWQGDYRVRQLPLAVLAAGLVVTGLVSDQVRRLAQDKHNRQEQAVAHDVGEAISAKLGINIALLSSVAGLFRASNEVDRGEFATFYSSIATESSSMAGIQGLGFSRWIPAADLPAFVGQIRAEGFPAFQVRPPGARPFYSAIQFLEPFDWRNSRAFGFDMFSEPVRREAMERAVRTGQASLSGRVTLLQETESQPQPGVLMYVPIFRGDVTQLSLAERFSRLEGWSYSPLRTRDLIGSALEGINNPDLAGSRVAVFDGSGTAAAQLLYDNRRGLRGEDLELGQPLLRSLELAGRTWTLAVDLNASGLSRSGLNSGFWLTLVSGMGLAALAAMATRLLVDNHLATRAALRTSEEAIEERALASTVFEASSLAIVVTNADGYILTANNAFTQLSGYRVSEILGQRTNLLKSGKHEQGFYKGMWDTLLAKGFWEGDVWNKVRSGELRRHHLAISTVRDEQLRTRAYVGMLQDITERHAAEEQVRYQALHDTLTGLANRSLLMEQLEREVALGQRHGSNFGVIYIDLDGFKPVNDRLGHAAGDDLLTQVAGRLRSCTRESDLTCRQGGDEFVVLVPQAGEIYELEALAAKLLAQLQQPFSLESRTVEISGSIGVARYPDHGSTADALLQAADDAMYRSKAAGGGKVRTARPA